MTIAVGEKGKKMPRLIDAEKLKNHYSWWEGGSREMTMDEAKKTFDTIIDVQPTVDIVHCKECKHWRKGLCRKNPIARVTVEYDFCSEGERDE